MRSEAKYECVTQLSHQMHKCNNVQIKVTLFIICTAQYIAAVCTALIYYKDILLLGYTLTR